MSATEGAPGRALIFGLGRFGGGAGAARRLLREGWEVTATDLRSAQALAPTLESLGGEDLRLVLGHHEEQDFDRAALVVVNPAVRPDHALLARARRAGARLTTEVELFLERAANPLLAVTGTQGKSSTVRMTADLLTEAGVPARAGGNLGGSLLDDLDELDPEEVCVLELSSYQLEHLSAPVARMRAVAVTNVLADHLERHGTREAYARAKARILELCADDGVALLPTGEDPAARWRPQRGRRVDVWTGQRRGPGLFREGGLFHWDDEILGREADLKVPGEFQRDNALYALGLARALGADIERLRSALGAARPLEHRLQDLGTHRGRRVVDNGVSTTPDSTVAALDSLAESCLLICGGEQKQGLPLEPLAAAASSHAVAAITFGAAAPKLAAAFDAAGVEVEAVATLEQAAAAAFARPGAATVLFSPACASFDAFTNFQDRALAFRDALPPPDAP